jgi:hypothetical protein
MAFDRQITEFTADMKLLVEDANEKIARHIKESTEQIAKVTAMVQPPANTQTNAPGRTNYASALINPPPHINPKLAAKEGIKARQFLLTGLQDTAYGQYDTQKLKTLINKMTRDLGLEEGKLRSLIALKEGGILVEVDSDTTARWFADGVNRVELCSALSEGVAFRDRTYNVIVFNSPLNLVPENEAHVAEIQEVNDLGDNDIAQISWAKPVNRRTPHQRTAHLKMFFSSPEAANQAITDGLVICNKKCHVEKIKREPVRCMKCQQWNHMARDCREQADTCSNCAGLHRTEDCRHPHIKRCISCKSNEHASWSSECPTFLRKAEDFKERNPESTLPFFPTEDSWTWSKDIPTNPFPLTNIQVASGSKATTYVSRRLDKGKAKEIVPPSGSQGSLNGIPEFLNTNLNETPNSSWWDDNVQALISDTAPLFNQTKKSKHRPAAPPP